MEKKKILASISILVNGREKFGNQINEIITANGHIVMARLGYNLSRYCRKDCIAVINLIAEGPKKEIDTMAKKISRVKGATVKTVYFNN